YDHVAPPGARSYGGLGFRIPLIAVAPFAKAGYISHNQYELGSIVRFIEDNWNLPRLGTTDERAADFAGDFFDFTQGKRKYHPIQTPYSRSYLLQRPPSNKPVDYE
ncbi:MAG TPA: alkaline phosphatase family protein, partial [Candidatus Nitrosotalea sp.]|nr:alkaline phosphatase family protein [Candidatus Nitrosotalea sp.]